MRFSSALLLSLIVAATVPSPAQVATGTPPFGSFGGGPFDTVNLGNLNVHFAIPVVHKAGRGMAFTYDLNYDNSIWTAVTVKGVAQWQPALNWGWRGQTETATGYWSYSYFSHECYTGRIPTGSYTRTWGYTYHDPYGTVHAFSSYSLLETGTCGNTDTPFFSSSATDGSGYTITAPGTFVARSGYVIHPPYASSTGAGTATDANGNQITVNSSGQFFDTLSSTAPVLTVSSAAPPTPTTFTYTSPSGSAKYTMNYTQYTVATDFG